MKKIEETRLFSLFPMFASQGIRTVSVLLISYDGFVSEDLYKLTFVVSERNDQHNLVFINIKRLVLIVSQFSLPKCASDSLPYPFL